MAKGTRKKPKPRMGGPGHRPTGRRRIPWIGAIGGLLIFGSWFAQNKYSADLAEARRNMDSSITLITLAASSAENWMARYVDLKSQPNPDKELLLTAAFKALQWNLLSTKIASDRAHHDDWAAALVSNDPQFRKTSEALVRRFEQGNLEALETDLRSFVKLDNEQRIRAQFDSTFRARLAEVSKRKKLVDFVVIALYVAGSVFAIWDFFVRNPGPSNLGEPAADSGVNQSA